MRLHVLHNWKCIGKFYQHRVNIFNQEVVDCIEVFECACGKQKCARFTKRLGGNTYLEDILRDLSVLGYLPYENFIVKGDFYDKRRGQEFKGW